jgi:hypothetical protein
MRPDHHLARIEIVQCKVDETTGGFAVLFEDTVSGKFFHGHPPRLQIQQHPAGKFQCLLDGGKELHGFAPVDDAMVI